MATASAADVEPNLTECTVCNETFTVPKILPCGHLLCRDCLVNWLQSQSQAGCPLCRGAIVDHIKQGGRSVEEVANGFPTDLAMTAMVEAETLLSKQHVCCVCVDVAAVALCLQCGDMFCQHCSNLHKKQAVSKHHEVEDLSSLTTEKLAAHHPATCPDHTEKPSEVYCPTHGVSVCLLCATTSHRQCPHVVSLPNKVAEWAAQLAQLTAMLTEAEIKVDAGLHLLDKHVKELKSESQSALDKMKIVCDRLKAAIDARFLKVSDVIQKFVSEITEIATDARQSMLQKRTTMTSHKTLTKLYQNFKGHTSFCDMTSIVKIRIQELDLDSALPANLQLNRKVTVTIDHQAVARIEQELSRLGQVAMTPVFTDTKAQAQAATSAQGLSSDIVTDMVRPSDVPQQHDVCDVIDSDRSGQSVGQQTKGVAMTFDPMNVTASPGVTIETHPQSERESPLITCIAVGSSSEHLYMADRNNAAIKVFSLNPDRLISTLTLDVQPWRVAVVSDSLLASTSWDNNVLVLIDVSNKLKPRVKSIIKTKRQYHGVGVMTSNSDDTKLVVSCYRDDAGPSGVDVITLTGEVIRTIITSQTLPGLTLPWYLHVDTPRDVLYMSDGASHCVWRVELTTGRVLQTLTHPQMSGPGQVCTDRSGNMYVAGGQCVLVKSVGDVWRVLLAWTDHGEGWYVCPLGISVTDTGLVVSWWSVGSGTVVKKYDLV